MHQYYTTQYAIMHNSSRHDNTKKKYLNEYHIIFGDIYRQKVQSSSSESHKWHLKHFESEEIP